jgi:hypothetical protein
MKDPRTDRIVDAIFQADEGFSTAFDCIILDTIINHCGINRGP